MGTGIRLGDLDPELQAALEDMRDQLLLVLVRRLGGKARIPVREIDQTGGFLLDMIIEGEGPTAAFKFTVRKKQ